MNISQKYVKTQWVQRKRNNQLYTRKSGKPLAGLIKISLRGKMRSNALGAGKLVDDNSVTSILNLNTDIWQNAIY